jgi:hypothetical protein
METEAKTSQHSLAIELNSNIREYRRLARVAHWTSVIFMAIALGCSIAAGIFGLVAHMPRVSGVLAILPTLIAFVVVNLKLDGKACWYFDKLNAFEALRTRLLYELPDPPTLDNIAAVAHSRTTVVDALEQDWNKNLMLDWTALSKPPDPRLHVKSQSNGSSVAH